MSVPYEHDAGGQVYAYVARKVSALQKGCLSQGGQAAARLAHLRRAVGKAPGTVPEVWELEFEGLPAALVGRGSDASAGEWAVHLALSLYAVHQQSQLVGMYRPTDFANDEYHNLGHAVRQFARRDAGEELEPGQMPRRFSALVTAGSIQEVAHYARQLVQQLRAAGIPLDYAALARQLYHFQLPYRRDSVRLEWGREYAKTVVVNDGQQEDQS